MSERPAAVTLLLSGTVSAIDSGLLWWVSPIPPAVYETNAES